MKRPTVMRIAVLLAIVATSCTTSGAPASSPTEATQPTPTIAVGSLSGKILFARAGGRYGDETVFTADADGTNQRRVTPLGAELPDAGQCCPRWAPDGTQISIVVPGPDGRVAPAIIDADGTAERRLPLPD